MKRNLLSILLLGTGSFAMAQVNLQTLKNKNNVAQSISVFQTVNGKNNVNRKSNTGMTFPTSSNKISLNIIEQHKNKDGSFRFLSFERPEITQKNGIQLTHIEDKKNTFLKELDGLIHFSEGLSFENKNQSNQSDFIRLKQTFKQIPIFGKEVVLHFNENGRGTSFNGQYIENASNSDISIHINKNKALDLVKEHLISHQTKLVELSENDKKLTHTHSIQKVWFENKLDELVLCYEINFAPNILEHWTYLVNVKSGNIENRFSNHCSADVPTSATATDLKGESRTVNTLYDGTQYYMADISREIYNNQTGEGYIVTVDAQNGQGNNNAHINSDDNTWNNPTAISAHYNAGIAYEYYRIEHNRNSIDGIGGNIISLINVTDENGNQIDNAYWNGRAMFYGNGNTAFTPLAKSLDVAGHEMTHGVVQNSANLVYQDESGAINESMADVFGALMDAEDWLIGEDITKTSYIASGALRSLEDPHNGGTSLNNAGFQPSHVNEQYTGSQDNGGVHINSGIPNHAFYLFATTTSRDVAGKVYYRALTQYLTRSSNFIDLRIAVLQSANDLYPNDASVATKAGEAFTAVGIVSTTTTTPPSSDIDVNKGEKYLISLRETTQQLQISNIDGSNLTIITSERINSKPSVTDNGKHIYYINNEGHIKEINLTDLDNPELNAIETEFEWHNVAVSKDGKRLAAISAYTDTSIYIINLKNNEITQFKLYNPTYTEGIKAPGPRFATTVEFSHDGSSVVYDAYNELINGNDTLWYFDVGFMNVWSSENNSIGSGTISKLFSSLPFGINIINPSFSKNSRNILAFDKIDVRDNTTAIFIADLETGNVNTLTENNAFGYPNFSVDDTHLAFSSFDENKNQIIQKLVLNEDKMTTNSSPQLLLTNSFAPVFFATGERVLKVDNFRVDTNKKWGLLENPVANTLKIKTNKLKATINIYDLIGNRVLNMETNPTDFTQVVNVNHLQKGIYFIEINGQTEKFIKR